MADDTGATTIKAGTNNQTILAKASYWSSGARFWLRSPDNSYKWDEMYAVPGGNVGSWNVYREYDVRPASNLNLSSVLFASGAQAASSGAVSAGTITSDTAMTLRLDGTDTAIGTVIYDATNGKIAAQKDAGATGIVSLVVQGNDGTNDWYYSVPVGGTTVVTAEQIKEALSLSEAPNLAACKIWLETTIDNVAYARTAESKTFTVQYVTAVEVTGMNAPVGGNAFDTEASCGTKGIATTIPAITYTTTGENGEEEVTGIADWNTTYQAAVTLATGIEDTNVYVFDSPVSVTVDEELLSDALAPRVDGTVTVTREFTTAKRKIVSVAAPEVPTDNTFTTYYGYEGYNKVLSDVGNSELGKRAMVTLEGTELVASTTEDLNVTWSVANADDAPYDKTPGAENIFRWTIPASEFANYDAADCANYVSATDTITGTVEIKNKAATPVTITGTDSSVAYTGETIDVSQYFTIDSHAGAATYALVTGADGGTGEKTITLTVNNGTIRYEATEYSGTYDGQLHSISVNVSNPSGTTITYSTDGKNYGSDNPSFRDEGTYTVYYRITKDNYDTIEASKTVIINKKSATITAENQDIIWGNDVDKSKYTVSEGGLLSGDSITEITLTPSTTALTENGRISISGVKIENATGKDVTDYTTNAASIDMSQMGEKTFTVSYTKNGVTKTKDITIQVAHDTTLAPVRIEATKTKTAYRAGDTLNVDDLTVTAYYADGYSEEVKDYTTNAADIDMSTIGNKPLTISYTKNGGTKTKDITITVSHNTALAPDRIEAVKTKTSYIAGDTLNVDDLTVTAYYKDGYSEVVTDYTTNAADIDMSKAGDKPLTVTYTENGVTKTEDIIVTVADCTHDGEREVRDPKTATCIEKGYTGDTYCKVCGTLLENGTETEMAPHSYVNGVCSVCDDIFKATVNGVTYQVMTETGADGKPVGKLVTVSGNEIPQVAVAVTGTGDDFTEKNPDGKVIVQSEITGSGSEQTFVVTKLSENVFSGASVTEIVVPATVTEVGTGAFGGVTTITFKGTTAPSGIAGAISETVTTVNVPEGAADSYREVLGENANIVEVHTHVKDKGTRVEPTCEKKGSITYKCTKCNKVMDVVELAATGHKWDAGKVTKEPSETAEGVKTYTCTVCKKPKTEAIPKKAATTPEQPKKGDVVTDDKSATKYEVADAAKKEVEYKAPANKKAKTVTIPSAVKINGVTYKVTKIDDNAFKGLTKATTIKVPKKKLAAYKKLFKSKGLSSKVKVKGY